MRSVAEDASRRQTAPRRPRRLRRWQVAVPGVAVSVAAVVAALLMPAASSAAAAPARLVVDSHADSALAADDSAFGGRLLAALTGGGGNVAVSPLSVAEALQMLYVGARGQTATQMAHVLRLGALTPAEVGQAASVLASELSSVTTGKHAVLSIANSLWVQSGSAVLPGYSSALSGGFAAELEKVNFADAPAAAAQIDNWVSHHTHGHITQLLSAQDVAAAELVVVDAVYLKDAWASPFPAEMTADAPFHLAGGATVSVPTMNQVADLGYRSTRTYQAVQLPYADGRLAMTILLPRGSVAALDAGLAARGLAPYLSGLGRTSEMSLLLPRFGLTDPISLNQVLSALGMPDAFGPAADFAGMSSDALQLSTVQTKTYIKVAERGTVAAAATGGVASTSAVVAPPLTVRVDKPFVFVISDRRTGLTLFAGQVTDPAAG